MNFILMQLQTEMLFLSRIEVVFEIQTAGAYTMSFCVFPQIKLIGLMIWKVLKCVAGLNKKEGKKNSQIKHVVEQRHVLVKKMLGGDLFVRSMCPHCKMPSRQLRTEHSNKVFFASGMKRKQALHILKKRRQMEAERGR